MLNKQMNTVEQIAKELGMKAEVTRTSLTLRPVSKSAQALLQEFETYSTRWTSQIWQKVAAQFHTKTGLQVRSYSGCAGSFVTFKIK